MAAPKTNSPAPAGESLAELSAQAQMLQRQAQAIEQQRQAIQAALVETKSAKESLTALQKSDAFMAPIGSRVFVPAKKTDDSVLVEVGAGVVVSQRVPQAVETLDKREAELTKAANSLESNLKALALQMQSLQARAQRATRE